MGGVDKQSGQEAFIKVPEAYRPNADMSLRDQFAQYAYGKTIAAVMSDPARDVSEIAIAASRANMDVIFGEEHTVLQQTLKQIGTLLENAQPGQFKGVALEMSVDLQVLLTPDSLANLSREDFIYAAMLTDAQSMAATADTMLAAGEIDAVQSGFIHDIAQDLSQKIEDDRASGVVPDEQDWAMYGALYDLSQKAAEKEIPVYAADMDRQRLVGMILNGMPDADLHMPTTQFGRIFEKELDDRSDVKYLEDMGVDIKAPGSLIVHRGYGHISSYSFLGDTIRSPKGFDDILEERGRHVVTFGVIDEMGVGKQMIFHDPADFTIDTGMGNVGRLDRSDYEGLALSEMAPISAMPQPTMSMAMPAEAPLIQENIEPSGGAPSAQPLRTPADMEGVFSPSSPPPSSQSAPVYKPTMKTRP